MGLSIYPRAITAMRREGIIRRLRNEDQYFVIIPHHKMIDLYPDDLKVRVYSVDEVLSGSINGRLAKGYSRAIIDDVIYGPKLLKLIYHLSTVFYWMDIDIYTD